MAVTVNGSVLTQTDVTSPSPSTLTYTSTVLTAGDILVSVVVANSPSTFGTFSAPTGGTGLSWTQIILQQNTAGHFTEVVAYWTKIPSDQTSTITVSTTNTSDVGTGGALLRLSGADQVTPIGLTDGFQGQTDPTGTDLQLSGTKAGSLIIMVGSDWSAGTASLTVSISSTTGGVTDLSNLESGQFRAVVAHAFQSGSTNQGTLDYSAATGDWAAIIFEIQAAPAAGGLLFRPGQTWKRVYKHRQRLPIPPDVTGDVRSVPGESQLGLSADVTAGKIAVVTAAGSFGLAGISTAAKITPAVAAGTVGLAANFVHVDIRPVTAATGLGMAATGTARKITPATLNAPLGLAATSTAKKVGKAAATGTAGLASTASARKIAPATGRGVVGLQASFAHVEIHPITALGGLGITALATVKKRATPLAAGTLGLTGNTLPRKISKSTGVGTLPLVGLATVGKKQTVTARAPIGLSAWWDRPLTIPKAGLIEPGTRAFAGVQPGTFAGAGAEPGTRGSAMAATGGKAGAQIEPGTTRGPNIEEGT